MQLCLYLSRMSFNQVLSQIRQQIKDEKELQYFLTHKNRYKFLLEKVCEQLPAGAKILDVGCYPLHLFKALEILGYEVWGISSFHEVVGGKKIKVLNIEKDKFPFKKDFFDFLTTTFKTDTIFRLNYENKFVIFNHVK